MNLTHWKCLDCGKNFFVNAQEKNILCPDCDDYDRAEPDAQGIIETVRKAAEDYEAPKPEFELDELVLYDVKEPKIEYFSTCKQCEIPLMEDDNDWCEECYRDMIGTLHGVWSPAQTKLKN